MAPAGKAIKAGKLEKTGKGGKRPGRPAALAEQDVRQQLLQAAATCLGQKSWSTISIREVAAAAGTNSAMVSYYFGGKAGLVHALLESVMAGNLLPAVEASVLAPLPAVERLPLILAQFRQLFDQHPWLLRLIVDDLVNEDKTLRKAFVSTLAGGSGAFLSGFIRLQQQDGYYRSDIHVTWATVSLLSLMTFPLLATPILKDAYGVNPKDLQGDPWINHVQSMFEGGLRATKE
ncbi:MAG: TetR/AcrR family transcriptional regulator [Gammaproteobacteria bacterium]|nr:MAG: TetR/AcrR family transcriptional regulator [Gammaproteobacteria bacterium]